MREPALFRRENAMIAVVNIIRVVGRIESFRLSDENENEFFSILSNAHSRTNSILARKCDSHRHSTTSFNENVVVAKTSFYMLGILSFSDG